MIFNLFNRFDLLMNFKRENEKKIITLKEK